MIFLLLLAIIVLFGDAQVQRMSLVALAVATASFYWRLFPLIRSLDRRGQIEPKNYSTVLGIMIFVFIVMFVIGAIT